MNCKDDYIDPFAYGLFPRPSWINGCYTSRHHERCEAIRKQLCKNGLKANVHRHTCFGVHYYVIRQLDKKTNFGKYDIVKALEIPHDWVSLANHTDGIGTYWVKEDELNDKYCDCDGELVFKSSEEIMIEKIKEYLNEHEFIKGSIDASCGEINVEFTVRR